MNMIKKLWNRYFAKPEPKKDILAKPEPKKDIPAGPAVTPSLTFGEPVVFTNGEKNITRAIVGERGFICDFPGIDEEVPAEYANTEPVVCYRTDFERRADGNFLMIWEIQPDGRYWADEDGFGMTNDEEVRLYSVIDGEGRFLHPFKLYNCGVRKYYSWTMDRKDDAQQGGTPNS